MGDCATVWQHYLACHQHTGLKSYPLCMKDCATVYKSLASKPWLKVSAAFNNASARLYKEKMHYWTIMGARCLRLSICFLSFCHFCLNNWRTRYLFLKQKHISPLHPHSPTHTVYPLIKNLGKVMGFYPLTINWQYFIYLPDFVKISALVLKW